MFYKDVFLKKKDTEVLQEQLEGICGVLVVPEDTAEEDYRKMLEYAEKDAEGDAAYFNEVCEE